MGFVRQPKQLYACGKTYPYGNLSDIFLSILPTIRCFSKEVVEIGPTLKPTVNSLVPFQGGDSQWKYRCFQGVESTNLWPAWLQDLQQPGQRLLTRPRMAWSLQAVVYSCGSGTSVGFVLLQHRHPGAKAAWNLCHALKTEVNGGFHHPGLGRWRTQGGGVWCIYALCIIYIYNCIYIYIYLCVYTILLTFRRWAK